MLDLETQDVTIRFDWSRSRWLETINSKSLQRSGWRNVLPSMSRRLESFSNRQYRPPVAFKLNANTLALKLSGEWLQELVMSVEWLQTGIGCCTGNLGTGLVTSRLQWWPVNCMKNADLSVNTRQLFSRRLWNRHVTETRLKGNVTEMRPHEFVLWSTSCLKLHEKETEQSFFNTSMSQTFPELNEGKHSTQSVCACTNIMSTVPWHLERIRSQRDAQTSWSCTCVYACACLLCVLVRACTFPSHLSCTSRRFYWSCVGSHGLMT